MQCAEETLARLFYTVSTSSFLLLIFFYFSSVLVSNHLSHFLCNCTHKFSPRTQHSELEEFYTEAEEEEEEMPTAMSAADADRGPTLHPDDDDVEESEIMEEQEMVGPTLLPREDEEEEEESGDEEVIVMKDAKVGVNFEEEERFLVLTPRAVERVNKVEQGSNEEEALYGSTSKSSSEWRSSITNRDSGSEDPFSSSSRRSCPKWESYTVCQKYDEEMTFLDRISAQKLHETESIKSFQECPRSISDRIVYKLGTGRNGFETSSSGVNPYLELEAAYVAQICLTWEALNWNHKKLQNLRAARRGDPEPDPGCPGHVAQQFQQFQVLLQRYVENEPYEHGRRPEIYARMRLVAPKLLQVPEYRDSENDEGEEGGLNSRVAATVLLGIIEDGMRTFMKFLKADKENRCQVLMEVFFRKKQKGSVDPILLRLVQKANKKKKQKLKELRRAGKCVRRRRRLKAEEEMEIFMGLVDMKVVSRVLRLGAITDQHLQWCEEKIRKVRVGEGSKLQRDSSPLFFPSH